MIIPPDLNRHVTEWVKNHPLEPIHVDCSTTVILKILDGKCKMKPDIKVVMELLYDQVRLQQGTLLGGDHNLAARNEVH